MLPQGESPYAKSRTRSVLDQKKAISSIVLYRDKTEAAHHSSPSSTVEEHRSSPLKSKLFYLLQSEPHQPNRALSLSF